MPTAISSKRVHQGGRKTAPPSKKLKQDIVQPASETSDDPADDGDSLDGDNSDVIEFEDVDDENEEEDGSNECEHDEGELDEEEEGPAAGPSRSTPASKHLYKPPTASDIDLLASSASNSSFDLQVDALVSSTILSKTADPSLSTLLASLHSHILALPHLPSLSPAKAAKRLKGFRIPFTGPQEYSPIRGDINESEMPNWVLGWDKPEEIFIGGSWGVVGGYKKAKGEAGGVDLVVIMPNGMFSPKDRMDFRYFHKRSHYLAVVAQSLQKPTRDSKSPLSGMEVGWGFTGGDTRRPCITLKAGKGLKRATEIRIHAGVSSSLFPSSAIQPSKSLLRHADLSGESSPYYNTSIMRDTLHKSDLLYLHRLASTLSHERALASFLALWRIWSTRRGISREKGGSGWFAGALAGWVVEGGEVGGKGGIRGETRKVAGLGKGLGGWQLLRAALEFIAHTDFPKTPVFMGRTSEAKIPPSEFISSSKNVLVDPTGSVNLLYGLEDGDLQMLQHHASETLAMLEDSSVDRFAEVFLKDQSLGPHAFDEYIHVDISELASPNDLLTRCEKTTPSTLFTHLFERILRRGLSDRIKLLVVREISSDVLSVGLTFDSAHATRVVDIGPSSEKAAEVAAFQELWGDKAETRRFKDGSISESIVWEITRPEDATQIPARIVQYLLDRHFGCSASSMTFFSSDPTWSTIVQVPASARQAINGVESEKQGFRPIIAAYDELYKLLKNSDDDLPLAILTVQPASELLRYSSTFIPHPIDPNRYPSAPDCLKYVPSADIILQFESSPRWPDDLAGIQKVKLAMFEKLARLIGSQQKGTKTNIVMEDGRSEIEDHAYLEVFTKGFGFNIRIYNDRERILLERVIDGETQTFGTALPQPPLRLALPALELHIRRHVWGTAHHSAIAPYHHRYPSYSSATRLLKRWLSAHMLGLLVPTEVIELIMVNVYLDSRSLGTPGSAVAGFIRAIELLANWDWKTEPLVVPVLSLNDDAGGRRIRFPFDKRQAAMKVFEARKKKEEGNGLKGGWRIITEDDLEGGRWTSDIGAVVAGRTRALARGTLDAIKQLETPNVKALFTTPTRDYDVVIHLDTAFVTRYAQAVDPDTDLWEEKMKYKNLGETGVLGDDIKLDVDLTGTFARDIQRLYGDSILVFFDVYGGSVIGLLWNPAKFTPRSLKPFLGYNAKPAQTKTEAAHIEMDKMAVLAEITRMGQGLIERVDVKRS